MFNKLSWYLAYRYLNSQQKNFVSFITVISVIGVALGTAILIIVLSVLNGFRDHIENNLLQATPHIIIENISDSDSQNSIINQLNKTAGDLHTNIKTYSLIKENGLIKTNKSISPVNIVSQFAPVNAKIKTKNNTVEISKRLADKLNLAINDKIILAAPILKNSIIGPEPRFKRFIIKSILGPNSNFNMAFYNDMDILMPYSSAVNFFDLSENHVSGIYIYMDKPLLAEALKQIITENNTGTFKVSTWYDYNRTLFQAIKLERISIILLLLIIITVAAFNLISGLYIQVSEKQKSMAILKTYGLNRVDVSTIFVIQGLIIGLFGCFIGAFFGLLISYNLDFIFYWLQHINVVNTSNIFFNAIASHDIKISPDLLDVTRIIIIALFMCITATILPAYRASKILPIENLRNE